MEIQRDSGHFEPFDNCVGKYEDWYSDLSCSGVFGDKKYFGFDFAVVERLNDGYFEDGVAFGGGCFEEGCSFVGCRSILLILGSQIYNRRILRRCRWMVLGWIHI